MILQQSAALEFHRFVRRGQSRWRFWILRIGLDCGKFDA